MSHKALLLGTLFVVFLLLEVAFPLRKSTQPKTGRVISNLTIAAFAAVVVRILFFPLVLRVSEWTVAHRIGILPALHLSGAVTTGLGLIALDYTLYFWHRMNHEVPFLWRFHIVHHVDLDMDTSTAARFHFGELSLSTGFRAAQIILFGVSPETWLLFETVITCSALFHHANLRLPLTVERFLNGFIVTPRMHGIHHSVVRRETDSNYSVTVLYWDWIHRTLRLDIPQERITIGVPEYRNPRELTTVRSLALPFRKQPHARRSNG